VVPGSHFFDFSIYSHKWENLIGIPGRDEFQMNILEHLDCGYLIAGDIRYEGDNIQEKVQRWSDAYFIQTEAVNTLIKGCKNFCKTIKCLEVCVNCPSKMLMLKEFRAP